MPVSPRYLSQIGRNSSGQISLAQPSVFSFSHGGCRYLVQLVIPRRNRNFRIVRLLGFIGTLPYSIQGGVDKRLEVIKLVAEMKAEKLPVLFHINIHQMLLMTYEQTMPAEFEQDVSKYITLACEGIYLATPYITKLQQLLGVKAS